MLLKLLFSMVVILFASSLNATNRTQDPPLYSCALKNSFVMGSSISSGYDRLSDGFRGKLAAYLTGNYFVPTGSGIDPITHITKKVLKEYKITKISELVVQMRHRSYASRQFSSYIKNKKNLQSLKKSSMIFVLDGFYWQTVHNKCDEAIKGMNDILDFAVDNKIEIMLGNVPDENPKTVDWPLKVGGWRKPNSACVARVNRELKNICTADNGCYLLDLHSLIQELNETGKVVDGVLRKTRDVRFDGIHLTEFGRNYVSNMINNALTKNPPSCSY